MKIIPGRLKEASYSRNIWCATPEAGTSIEDIQQPEYWAHVAKQIRPGDRIEVISADGTWFVELFVRSGNDVGLTVFPLRVVNIGKQPMPITAPEGSTDAGKTGEGDDKDKVATTTVTETEGKKDAGKTDPAEGFEIKFAGAAKFRIIRKSDKEVIESGIATKEEAETKLAAYIATLA